MIYSVVIPLKNEEHNIVHLFFELSSVMNELKAPWELICVDDGSTDETLKRLDEAKAWLKQLRVISFDQNYGQSSAFDAGFRASSGEFIITLDGDMQNDPQDIVKMVSMKDQFDLICGIRAKRKDTFIKRVISKTANRIRGSLLGDHVKDSGCSLKIYRKSALERIKLFHGMHRFLPTLFMIEGFRVGEMPVNHRGRLHGKSNYSFKNRNFNTLFDLLAVYWMRKRALRYKVR